MEKYTYYTNHVGPAQIPCEDCGGSGERTYPSTATWRNRAGVASGQMITSDVCDRCWGTGDEQNRGANLRDVFRRTQ